MSAAIKERPILFSAPMVNAILEGRKTQTRRVVKFPADYSGPSELGMCIGGAASFDSLSLKLLCPYGTPGDRLWVRETHRPSTIPDTEVCGVECHADGLIKPIENTQPAAVKWRDLGPLEPSHEAPEKWLKWRPSIHMPRWASRITLEVTDVRVERLQDISEEDAIAEGIGMPCNGSYSKGFEFLWESINGPDSWEANPWVWVVEWRPTPPADSGGQR